MQDNEREIGAASLLQPRIGIVGLVSKGKRKKERKKERKKGGLRWLVERDNKQVQGF